MLKSVLCGKSLGVVALCAVSGLVWADEPAASPSITTNASGVITFYVPAGQTMLDFADAAFRRR